MSRHSLWAARNTFPSAIVMWGTPVSPVLPFSHWETSLPRVLNFDLPLTERNTDYSMGEGEEGWKRQVQCPLAMEKRQRVSVPLLQAKVAQSPRNRLKIVILSEQTRLLRLIRVTSSLWGRQYVFFSQELEQQGKERHFSSFLIYFCEPVFPQTTWVGSRVLSYVKGKEPFSWK